MGCSSSKNAAAAAEPQQKPENVAAAAQRAGENTLLSAPASGEKKKEVAVAEKKEEKVTQAAHVLGERLTREAERVFKLADEDGKGYIDMADFASMRRGERFKEVMRAIEDIKVDGKLSLPEWLEYIKTVDYRKEHVPQVYGLPQAHPEATEELLKLYEKYIRFWPVKRESDRFFTRADKEKRESIRIHPHLTHIEKSVGADQLRNIKFIVNGCFSRWTWNNYVEMVHMADSDTGSTSRDLLKLCNEKIGSFRV